jgi:transcriptional regulator with XRE-family HTH domain
MVSFAELLRGFRGVRGLTQEELAERSGLSVYAISMLERGVRTAPRSSTVELLARALELDTAERAALAAAARARPARPAAVPAEPRSEAGLRWVSVLSVPSVSRRLRFAAMTLACLLALLVIGSNYTWSTARLEPPPPGVPPPQREADVQAREQATCSTAGGRWSTASGMGRCDIDYRSAGDGQVHHYGVTFDGNGSVVPYLGLPENASAQACADYGRQAGSTVIWHPDTMNCSV